MRQSSLEKFHHYFEELYQDRWKDLYLALQEPRQKVYRDTHLVQTSGDHTLERLSYSIQEKEGAYGMDLASFLPPLELQIEPGETFLDACSAPGGKALIMAESLKGKGKLYCNEPSLPRLQRLRKVMQEYLSKEEQGPLIFLSGKAEQLYQKKLELDGALVDAPCSSERHLMHKNWDGKGWSRKRVKRLSAIQVGILCSVAKCVKSGGRMVYSTCSLSDEENDKVIERFLSKYPDWRYSKTKEVDFSEATQFGRIVLPDTAKGLGPLYYAKLVSLKEKDEK